MFAHAPAPEGPSSILVRVLTWRPLGGALLPMPRAVTLRGPVNLSPERLALALSSRINSVMASFQSLERILSPCVLGNGASGVIGIETPQKVMSHITVSWKALVFVTGSKTTRLYITPPAAAVRIPAS